MVPKILLEREDNPEKGGLMLKWGVVTLLLYRSIGFTLCVCVCVCVGGWVGGWVWVGESKVSFITFWCFILLS